MSANFRRLQRLERKFGVRDQVPRGLAIVDGSSAELQSWSGRFPITKITLIRGNDESAEQFDRRVAEAATRANAVVMSRAAYEETAARLLREVEEE
jgi:hypothetical protein